MVGNNVLLDTVIIAGYFNRDTLILNKLKTATIYVSSISIGELYFGAYKSSKVTQNIANIRQFIEIVTIVGCDAQTADWYGQIKHALRTKGRPIPENDIWISAIALQHGLTLATRDAHFHEVDHLLIDRW